MKKFLSTKRLANKDQHEYNQKGERRSCSIKDCENTGKLTRGWCTKHYARYRAHGDPLFTKTREHSIPDKELLLWMRSPPQSEKDPETGCREWLGSCNSNGYGTIKYDGKMVLVHRLVWYLVYKRWPEDMLLHSCDNPCCINIKHLREGSAQDNMRDRDNKNRQTKGKDVDNARLTENQVIKIRRMGIIGKYTQKEIGEMFGISRENVSLICSRKRWKHVL